MEGASIYISFAIVLLSVLESSLALFVFLANSVIIGCVRLRS